MVSHTGRMKSHGSLWRLLARPLQRRDHRSVASRVSITTRPGSPFCTRGKGMGGQGCLPCHASSQLARTHQHPPTAPLPSPRCCRACSRLMRAALLLLANSDRPKAMSSRKERREDRKPCQW